MESVWIEVVLISVAIVANGFFSGSEIALVSARPSRLAHLRDERVPGAERALDAAGATWQLVRVPGSFELALAAQAAFAAGADAVRIGRIGGDAVAEHEIGRLRLGRRIKRRGRQRQQADAEGTRDRNCARSFHRDPIMISCRLLARVFCTTQLFRTTLLRQAIL